MLRQLGGLLVGLVVVIVTTTAVTTTALTFSSTKPSPTTISYSSGVAASRVPFYNHQQQSPSDWNNKNRRRTTTTTTRTSFASAVVDSSSSSSETSSTSDEAETLSLFSPCKINLFLRIIRKREDGFHDLASLFQAIGFGDRLELTPLGGSGDGDGDDNDKDNTINADEFTCNMDGVPTDSSNLVLRAIQLMREKTGVQQYFRANLIKQVPAQAGLGGGSANAATAMWATNELMGRPASVEQVCID